jgi:ketosteroid isomerase-like protein
MTDARTATSRTPKEIAETYFKLTDAGAETLSLFGEHAYVCFPKHTPARGIKEVTALFGDIGKLFTSVVHEVAYFNYVEQGERVVVEGFTHGVLADGTPWRATETLGGRFCNVFEVRDGLIQRLHIYLDPDYGDSDTGRYPWLATSAK